VAFGVLRRSLDESRNFSRSGATAHRFAFAFACICVNRGCCGSPSSGHYIHGANDDYHVSAIPVMAHIMIAIFENTERKATLSGTSIVSFPLDEFSAPKNCLQLTGSIPQNQTFLPKNTCQKCKMWTYLEIAHIF
jgi:hypothetical protein